MGEERREELRDETRSCDISVAPRAKVGWKCDNHWELRRCDLLRKDRFRQAGFAFALSLIKRAEDFSSLRRRIIIGICIFVDDSQRVRSCFDFTSVVNCFQNLYFRGLVTTGQ